MKYKLSDLMDSLGEEPLAKMVFSNTGHLQAQVMRLKAGVQISDMEILAVQGLSHHGSDEMA